MKNRGLSLIVFLLALFFTSGAFAAAKQTANPQVDKGAKGKSEKGAQDLGVDQDLAQISSPTVRNRMLAFRQLIRKQPTRQAKINKAIRLMNDPKSPYRADAVLFLASVRAEGVIDDLYAAAKKEKTLRGHVAMAYGQMGNPQAIPYLIRMLSMPSPMVKGRAYESLVKLTKMDYDFDPDESQAKRQAVIELYKTWWKNNKDRLKKPAPNPDEQQEAEEKWRLYGEPYLHRAEAER